MTFFLLNLAYAGKLVVFVVVVVFPTIIIAGSQSSVCAHPNDICQLVALDLFYHECLV
jgi:hypothetical protein